MGEGCIITYCGNEENLVDSSFHLPVFGKMFNVNVVWYDSEEKIMYAVIKKMVKVDEIGKGDEIY